MGGGGGEKQKGARGEMGREQVEKGSGAEMVERGERERGREREERGREREERGMGRGEREGERGDREGEK